MGVITTHNLPAGRVYGPIPPSVTLTDPMVMIGHMTTDSRPDVHTVKVNTEAYSDGSKLAEWVPYVQAARDEVEQNVEAVLKDGQLFYRVIKNVREGCELFVWYSSDLAQIIGVPELHSSYIKDGGNFNCPYCHKWFRFPNCLRAHMRFKCESSRHIFCTSTTTKATTNMNLSIPTPVYHNQIRPHHSSSPSYQSPARISPSRSREDRYSEGGISPGSTSSGVSSASLSPPNSAEKRKREEDEDFIVASKKFLSHDLRQSPDLESKYSKSPSPVSNHSVTNEDSGSAFHKVERSIQSYQHPIGISSRKSGTSPPSTTNNNNKSPPIIHDTQNAPHPHMNNTYAMASLSSMPRLPVPNIPSAQSPQSQPSPFQHPAVYKESNMQLSLSDITRLANNLPVRARIPGMEAIAASGKLPFHPDWKFHLPFYKSQNPIVESILQGACNPGFQSMPVLQNWCAKCNATFRMTSDLVYHMRSHHKKEYERKEDPVKQEGKLSCNVCGERFRERHHLTRHMTSH